LIGSLNTPLYIILKRIPSEERQKARHRVGQPRYREELNNGHEVGKHCVLDSDWSQIIS
jgi:hypothetical protein